MMREFLPVVRIYVSISNVLCRKETQPPSAA
jgi:hypothetical protein